jgi:hypothetical protein
LFDFTVQNEKTLYSKLNRRTTLNKLQVNSCLETDLKFC